MTAVAMSSSRDARCCPPMCSLDRASLTTSSSIRAAVRMQAPQVDLLILTGGTGLGPRDVTPQALLPLLDYQVPGMAEAMRQLGLTTTPHAMLSRQVVGVMTHCLVLSLPGSPTAVAECLDAVWPALPHALALLSGDTRHHQARPAEATS